MPSTDGTSKKAIRGIPYSVIHQAALESSKDAILITDKDGFVLEYNQELLDLWGFTKEIMDSDEPRAGIGAALEQLVDPDSFHKPAYHLKEFQDKKTYDTHHFKDGRVMERYSKPLKFDGKYLGRIWFYYDITEKDRASRELKERHTILNAVFEGSSDGILVVGTEAKVLDYNKVYLEMFKMDPDFLINGDPKAVIEYSVSQIHEKERLRKEIYDLIKKPDSSKFSVIEFLDGRIVERFTAVLKNGDDILGRVLFYRDITEATNRINELINRTYELDKFIYSASHDLKAPLNSMMGLVDILKGEKLDQSAHQYLSLMDRSLSKLDTYIRNLAEFSQNENLAVGREKIDMNEVVNEAIHNTRFIEYSDKINFKLEIGSQPDFYSDPIRVRIIVNNLISNAVKYQDLNREDPWAEISFSCDENEGVLTVKDNGIGIVEENQEKVFNLFFRATKQAFGSGLGLYVTQNTVKKLEGSINCKSAPKQGIVFRVKLLNTLSLEKI